MSEKALLGAEPLSDRLVSEQKQRARDRGISTTTACVTIREAGPP